MSGALKTLGRGVVKIANDIRCWLASGPDGLNELFLPAKEPGVPSCPAESTHQAEACDHGGVQVMGNDTAMGFAGALGNFELNVFKPVMIYNLLQSIRLLTDGCESFTDNCVVGIVPNKAQIDMNVQASLMLVTALNLYIGYDKAAKVAQTAYTEGISLKEAAVKLGLLTAEEFDRYVRPQEMIGPKA
jgi:fumarate hydratase class II